jgi:glycosyltransferase involved in cell wall biosynthesis
MSSFEKALIRDGVDLLYLVSPSSAAIMLQRVNYIFTVWDLCHRDFPEFPEVRNWGEFRRREQLYSLALPAAFCVVTDSELTKEKMASYYGVNRDRIVVIPFQPSVACRTNESVLSDAEVLRIYDLEPGYLFYPAQYWAHKGHIRLLQALAIYRDRNNSAPLCVFCGSDQGALETVVEYSRMLKLDKGVRRLGFVPNEHIPSLYRNARALVMPTYFGPTNLPPLEAMLLGIPVIYPSHLTEQCGDAAFYFDVESPESLCSALEMALETSGESTRQKGYMRLREIEEQRQRGEQSLARMLKSFSSRLQCWQPLPI